VPLTTEGTANDTVASGQSIHVVAGGDVTVDAMYEAPGLSDGYLGLPTPLLGTSYIVGAVTGNTTCGNSEFELVATQNATTVTITPSEAIAGHAAGRTVRRQQLRTGPVRDRRGECAHGGGAARLRLGNRVLHAAVRDAHGRR
jgi:hypothetical protein